MPGLKGSYRSSLCYWCQCQRIWKDAEQGAQCYLFKYRQGQALRDWGWTACQYCSRKHFGVVLSAKLSCTQSLTCQAPAYYADNRVGSAKWQLKANTEHLNLRTGVFGRAACCWRERGLVRLQHENCYHRDINHGMNYKGASHCRSQHKNKRGRGKKKERIDAWQGIHEWSVRAEWNIFKCRRAAALKTMQQLEKSQWLKKKPADNHRGSQCQNNGWLPLLRSGLTTHECRWGGEVRVLRRPR